MRASLLSLFLFIYGFSICASASASPSLCTKDNYDRLGKLYLHANTAFVQNLFLILSCEGAIDSPNRQAQYVSLVGGLLRNNSSLISTVMDSATVSKNSTATKVVIYALWLCSTPECRAVLESRPFSLHSKDIESLLKQAPMDPYHTPIDSPAALDYLWGYFLGTGDAAIPKRILEEVLLKGAPEQGGHSILTYGAARWSFLSLAEQHERIEELLRERKGTSKEADELLLELTTSPKAYP